MMRSLLDHGYLTAATAASRGRGRRDRGRARARHRLPADRRGRDFPIIRRGVAGHRPPHGRLLVDWTETRTTWPGRSVAACAIASGRRRIGGAACTARSASPPPEPTRSPATSASRRRLRARGGVARPASNGSSDAPTARATMTGWITAARRREEVLTGPRLGAARRAAAAPTARCGRVIRWLADPAHRPRTHAQACTLPAPANAARDPLRRAAIPERGARTAVARLAPPRVGTPVAQPEGAGDE